jgi:hypothetical protein
MGKKDEQIVNEGQDLIYTKTWLESPYNQSFHIAIEFFHPFCHTESHN